MENDVEYIEDDVGEVEHGVEERDVEQEDVRASTRSRGRDEEEISPGGGVVRFGKRHVEMGMHRRPSEGQSTTR